MKNRQNNTTDWSKQQTFQGLDNVYESCCFRILVLDSATFIQKDMDRTQLTSSEN